MSTNSTVQKVIDAIRNIFSGNDRKRAAEQDDFLYPTKKFRRLGYDEEDEYSDTDMDDFLTSKNNRKTLNQKRQTIGTNYNHMSNGFTSGISSNTTYRTNKALPDDDVIFLSQHPPQTEAVYVTRLKRMPAHEPINIPPLLPLPRSSLNSTTTSHFSNTLPSTSRTERLPPPLASASNFLKPSISTKAIPINSFRAMNGGSSNSNSFLSATMMKQNNYGSSGFKGLNTIERLTVEHKLPKMGLSKSPPMWNSVLTVNREKNDKASYFKLLKEACPDIYSQSKFNCTEFVDLSKDEGPKGSSTKLIDLTTDDDKKNTTSKERNTSETEHVNSLLERLSCKPVFKEDLTDRLKEQAEKDTSHLKAQIEQEEEILSKRRNETDEAMRGFRKRYQHIPVQIDQLIQRIADGEDEEEEEEEVSYPPLTAEHQKIIKYAVYGGPMHEVIIDKFNLRITRNDLNTLVGMTWLNDEVINFYMNLIMERAERNTNLPKAYCFNTFFIPTLMSRGHAGVRRWTRKVDIFSYDLLPVPVHVGGIHWCMAIIRMKEKIIRYYDSMGNPNQPVLDAIERYLIDEAMDKKKIVLDTRDWRKESIRDCPQQKNGSDCGVFSCMHAEHLTRNAPLNFSQNEMPYFRQKMMVEIASGELIT